MEKILYFLKNNKKYFLIGLAVLFVLILSLFFFSSYVLKNGDMPIVSVSTDTKAGVIDLSSEFVVKTNDNYSEEEVSKMLYLDPAIDYDVIKLSPRKFEINPKSDLPANTIVNLGVIKDEVVAYKWAFQTESKLSVVGTFPANEKDNIPINTAIEISFSYANAIMDESQFSISPKVEGTLMKMGAYTWGFTPKNELLKNTKYTITVKKGITATNQVLNEDYTFSFTTEKEASYSSDKAYFYLNTSSHDGIETFTTKDKPLVYMESFRTKKTQYDVSASIYKVKDINEFINVLKNTDNIDTKKMTKYKEYILKYNVGIPFIQFTDLFEEGYYYVQILIDGNTINHFIQINNYVTYISNLENDNLIWVNDYLTGKPANNLEVSINNEKKNTDSSGVVIIPNTNTDKDDIQYVKIGSNKNNPLLVGIYNFSNDSYTPYPQAYIYSDKTLYKPTDEVKIWGFVPTYRFNKPANGKFKVSVGDYSKEITLNPDGTFETSISIKDYKDSYYSVQIYYNDTSIGYRSIDIYNYEKPIYTYTLNTDKVYYYQNENIDIDINVEHISGIKASNKNIKVVYKNYNDKKTYLATTDASGNAKLTIPALFFGNLEKDQYTIEVFSGDSEETSNYSQSKYIGVFARTYAVSSELKKVDNSFTLTINTYKVDLDKLNKKSMAFSYSDLYSTDYYGEKVNANVKLKTNEYIQTKTQNQKIYNPITKTYYYTYDYKYDNNVISTTNHTTVDGELKIENLPYLPVDNDEYYKTYSTEITLYDSNNKEVKTNEYYYPEIYNYNFNDSYNTEIPFNFQMDKLTYNLGDNISLSLKEKSDLIKKNDDGKVLSLVYKYGIIDYKITKANETIEYKYDDKIYPDGIITGVYYYDGRIYRIRSELIQYSTTNNELDIDISTNNTKYKPKDEVTANIKVKDINGNPVKGTVNISVVDEAIFLMSEDSTNILQTIYQRIYYQNYNYVSYRYYEDMNNGGGKGGTGGGPSDVRVDFKDTALFKTVETDNNGEATVKFKLPDSITTWRITVHGMTNSHKFGSSYNKIQSELPFFIQTTAPRNVKTTDDFVVSAVGLGSETGNVTYATTIKELKLTQQETGKMGEYVHTNFGNLPVGKYTVVISAISGNNKDSYQYNFEVKESFQETNITTIQKITGGSLTVNPTKNPVELYVYDETLDFYLNIINKLSTEYGDRVDIRIGNLRAKEFQAKYYRKEVLNSNIKLSNFQTDNGIKLLDKATENVLLSALAAKYSLNYFDETKLYNSFRNVIDKSTDKSEVFRAYMGLAALKKPVLLELNYLKKEVQRSFVDESLYLAMSYAFIGDYNTAKEIYLDEIKDIKPLNSKSNALKAILTSMIDVFTSKDIISNLGFDIGNNEYLTFALISYVENTAPYLENPNKFYITVNNEKKEYTVDKIHVLRILADKEELKTFKINSDSTTLMLEQRYVGNYKDIDSKNIKYKVNASIISSVSKAETTKLSIELTNLQSLSYGKVKISLPNGLRLDQATTSIADNVYLLDNKIDYIELAVSSKYNTTVKFNIDLIATNKGKYTIEPIIYEYDGKYGVSNELKLEVK